LPRQRTDDLALACNFGTLPAFFELSMSSHRRNLAYGV
jgi:hypothetical protein